MTMEPSRSRLPLLHHFSLLASLCSARWRDDSRGFLWYPAPRPPRRGPLAIVVYAHDETAMSLEQEDWEINGIDRSGLDAQVAEGLPSPSTTSASTPPGSRPPPWATAAPPWEGGLLLLPSPHHRRRKGGHHHHGHL
ncbi:hypothetical protein DAI22_01g243201 [Oryza sativa Japonica Group]|nr:hypothetical protein DAI22_01g243201 [Oryza sativa Japonica Group]